MILFRSPTLTLTFFYTLLSISLTILTVTINHDDFKNPLRTLIICPPLNCLFVFLLAATWLERLFRLSYLPFICLLILFCSSVTLTIISGSFLYVSIIIYFNLIFYSLCSIFLLIVIVTVIISYSYGALWVHRYRNQMTIEQQNGELPENIEPLRLDEYRLKLPSSDDELIIFMSKLPGRRLRHDIRSIKDDLEQIHVHTIITLNELKELSFMNMTKKNLYNMDIYASHLKRANIEHLIYPIRDRFIPKSLSDYLQFLCTVVVSVRSTHHNRLLVHCMGGMGRTGMTAVCLDLIYEYLMKSDNDPERKQTWLERVCHYPFLLPKSCRVCQAICKVRQARRGTIHNPLQILFAHEFYARLKSTSYMRYIKASLQRNETLLSSHFDDYLNS